MKQDILNIIKYWENKRLRQPVLGASPTDASGHRTTTWWNDFKYESIIPKKDIPLDIRNGSDEHLFAFSTLKELIQNYNTFYKTSISAMDIEKLIILR